MIDLSRHARDERAPRVLLLDTSRSVVDAGDGRLLEALSCEVFVRDVMARRPFLEALAVYRRAARLIACQAFECVHIHDARLAPVAARLRARLGVPVTASVGPRDLAAGTPWARLSMRALGRLDEAFVEDESVAAALRRRAPGVAVVRTPPVAQAPGLPRPQTMRAIARALEYVQPAMPVVAVPWPADPEDLRWLRDAVVHRTGRLCCWLVLGAPGRRQAWRLLGRRGAARIHCGPLDGDAITAAAAFADAFVLAGRASAEVAVGAALRLSLVATGVPVLAVCGPIDDVLQHEVNAFVSPSGDGPALVGTLERLFALPKAQRRAIGHDFASYTLRRWSAEAAAAAWAERFAALAGRPRIPAELLLAA